MPVFHKNKKPPFLNEKTVHMVRVAGLEPTAS